MKSIVNKMIPNLHWLILLYGLYSAWGMYEEHVTMSQEIEARITDLDGQIKTNEGKVSEIEKFKKQEAEFKVRVTEAARNIEKVQKQLPAETNDSQIISFFQKEISSLNIIDADITPGEEQKSTYFISKDYTIKAKGTFLQSLIFFERIASADRIYNIKNLKFANDNNSQRGRFKILSFYGVIQAYRFNPEFKVDRGIKE